MEVKYLLSEVYSKHQSLRAQLFGDDDDGENVSTVRKRFGTGWGRQVPSSVDDESFLDKTLPVVNTCPKSQLSKKLIMIIWSVLVGKCLIGQFIQ